MSQISRLKSAEITNGNLINADDLNEELNQLVSESNSQDSRLSEMESGNITFNGTKTFASAPKMDVIQERTAETGVTIDQVLLKDGTIKASLTADPVSPTEGELWYNSTQHSLRMHTGSTVKTLITDLSKGQCSGPAPRYASASSITIPAGLIVRSSDNTLDISVSSNLTLSLASSGALGLDTGAEASNTFYYPYLIADSTGTNPVSAIFSTYSWLSIGSVTLPAGYNKIAPLYLPVKNDTSSNIIPFFVATGWPYRAEVWYNIYLNGQNSGTPVTMALNGGSALNFTDVSLAAFVPTAVSKVAIVHHFANYVSASGGTFLRTKGASHDGREIYVGSSAAIAQDVYPIEVDPTGTIQYKTNHASAREMDVSVAGFIVTEVA